MNEKKNTHDDICYELLKHHSLVQKLNFSSESVHVLCDELLANTKISMLFIQEKNKEKENFLNKFTKYCQLYDTNIVKCMT